jgi:hypothetical protein
MGPVVHGWTRSDPDDIDSGIKWFYGGDEPYYTFGQIRDGATTNSHLRTYIGIGTLV